MAEDSNIPIIHAIESDLSGRGVSAYDVAKAERDGFSVVTKTSKGLDDVVTTQYIIADGDTKSAASFRDNSEQSRLSNSVGRLKDPSESQTRAATLKTLIDQAFTDGVLDKGEIQALREFNKDNQTQTATQRRIAGAQSVESPSR